MFLTHKPIPHSPILFFILIEMLIILSVPLHAQTGDPANVQPQRVIIKPQFEDFKSSSPKVESPAPIQPSLSPQPTKRIAPVPAPTPDFTPTPPAPEASPTSTTQSPVLPSAPPFEELPPMNPEKTMKFRGTIGYQVLLDRQFFSPGCIDGVMGRQSRQAIAAYQLEKNLPVTGTLDDATKTSLGSTADTLTTYSLTAEDLARLKAIPKQWKEKAKRTVLDYETALELVAEKFHGSQNSIRKLNPNLPWPNPPAGTVVTVPNTSDPKLPKAGLIQISLRQKILRIYDKNNKLIAQFPCSIAKKEEKRPVGHLEVIKYAPEPTYLFSSDLFVEESRREGIKGKLIIPAGPNNPVGVAWIGLNRPGYGIHGTPRPEDIGLTESHGCFRLSNWNAKRLLSSISIHTPVYVETDFPR